MTVNLTFDIADILGGDFDSRRTKVWLQTNIEGDVIIDATGNTIRLGHARATLNADGTGSFTGIPATNGATNPTAFQYQVHVDYPDRDAPNGRASWASGWFSLTASADLADKAAEAYVAPTWVSTFTADMDAIRDDARDAANDAAASASAAHDISSITVDDDVVEVLVKGTAGAGPKTRAALNSSFVSTDATRKTTKTAGLATVTFNPLTESGNVLLGPRTGRTVDDTASTNNVAIGQRCLEIGGTNADSNVALGMQAMGTTEGVGNVVLGYSALGGAESTNGPVGFVAPAVQNYNVALGYEAIIYGTDATDNVVLGHNAMTEIYSGLGNVAVGARALRAVKTTSRFNVAIGYSALDNGTVVGTNSLGDNVAIGHNAMAHATGSDVTSNVVVGAGAGDALTGRNNVLIGLNAGQAQNAAIENVGVGANALLSNTSGAALAAVGTDALRLNTTGSNNTALGWGALRNNTTGANNTAVGKQAATNTTGSNNVAVGQGALQSNTTGANTTAVGQGALTASTTATNNTAFGAGAGSGVTTGGVNTFLGQGAGAAMTTGSTGVFVGYNANGTAAGVNQTVLGHNASATANEGTALGQGATAGHANAVALGRSSSTTAVDQVMVGPRDIESTKTSGGIVFKSPDGTRYKLTPPNGGGAASWVAA